MSIIGSAYQSDFIQMLQEKSHLGWEYSNKNLSNEEIVYIAILAAIEGYSAVYNDVVAKTHYKNSCEYQYTAGGNKCYCSVGMFFNEKELSIIDDDCANSSSIRQVGFIQTTDAKFDLFVQLQLWHDSNEYRYPNTQAFIEAFKKKLENFERNLSLYNKITLDSEKVKDLIAYMVYLNKN